jgi:hypothetical protein
MESRSAEVLANGVPEASVWVTRSLEQVRFVNLFGDLFGDLGAWPIT